MCLLQTFQDDTAELGGTATSPNSINSILYALLTVNFFAAGIAYLYAPETTLEVQCSLTPHHLQFTDMLAVGVQGEFLFY